MSTVRDAQQDTEVDLARYGRFLAAQWPVLAGCAVVGAAVALGLIALASSRYQAVATLTVLPPPPGAAPAAVTALSAKALITSPAVADEIVDRLRLAHRGMTAAQFISQSVDVDALPTPNMLRITVVLADAANARAAAAFFADRLVMLSTQAQREATSRLRSTLEKSLSDADRSLGEVEDRLAKLQASSPPDGGRSPSAIGSASRDATEDARTQFYRRRLQVARIEAEYAERLRVYTALRQQYNEASGPSASMPQLQLVEAPVQPDSPLPRPRRPYATLGGLTGLLFGLLIAVIRQRRAVPLV